MLEKRFLFRNFLSFFEIFLNEERKLQVSFNEIPSSEIAKTKVKKIKITSFTIKQLTYSKYSFLLQ